MGGETEQQISGWTVDTLHVYINRLIVEHEKFFRALFSEKDLRDNQRFEAQQLALKEALLAQEKLVNAALLASQTAVNKTDDAVGERFKTVNEFRGTLEDQARNLMPRQEALAIFAAQSDKIDKLEQRVQEINLQIRDIGGRARGINEGFGYIIGAIGVITAIIAIVLPRL